MLSAVRFVFYKLISPLWRAEEVDEDGPFALAAAAVMDDIRHLRGSVVTEICLDYGLIDGHIYFTNAEVRGGVVLKKGDLVNCIAVRRGTQGGWKALKVEKALDDWETKGKNSLGVESLQLRPLIGTITSYDGEGGYINQNTHFSRQSLFEGYEPMKGDWVQAKYLVNPSQWTTQAYSVAPLRYRRLDKAQVTSLFAKSGVIEDTVIFYLDSLLLPENYQPTVGDTVNLVMVESSQSFYNWRALCIAPCGRSGNLAASFSEGDLRTLMENKGGLDVCSYGDFGDFMMGERRQLVIWIQNKGLETQTLRCCELAGWDSEKQFSLVDINRLKIQKTGASPEQVHSTTTVQEKDVVHEGAMNKEKESVNLGLVDVRRVEEEYKILPGARVPVTVACDAKTLGCFSELLLLHFSNFSIGRRLDAIVGSGDEALLKPSTPYSPLDRPAAPCIYDHVITVSTPKDPPKLSRRRLPSFLPSFPVPQALRDCVETQSDVLVIQPCLGEVLSVENMVSRFSTLLWLEELQAENEMKEFTISGALLKKGSEHLHVEVLGLAEGRPHLNTGDKIVLRKHQSDGVVVEIISYITEINGEDVSLRVNLDFHRSYLGEPLDIEFSYNRLTSRRCHYALEQVKPFAEILFPSRVIPHALQWTGEWIDESELSKEDENVGVQVMENGKASSVSIDMKTKGTQTKGSSPPSKRVPREGCFFNPDLNSPQKEAVRRILAGECRPTPYVLFGPPGTGKTITLIEAILQIYYFLPSSRLLVCTPSNSAADLICIRLHHSGFLDDASLARVNASCRPYEAIPEVLRPYSRAGEDVRIASYHRIVVSTCSSAGMFHNVGIQVGHFSHVFLDEAGQATEPEALIPISLVSEKDGQIVLAGDPRQLGPVIKSKLASAFGLGVSLLERLMANPLYSKHDWGYNPRLVTKLIYNYRSHEALLALPSRLFYEGELCVKAPQSVVESLCQWKALPKKHFPLLFHGVRGTEMREGNSPSLFNPVEAVQVMLYCCQLAKKIYKPVATSDIGIIAPYRKQCEKIRLLLNKVHLSDIKVGSVEEFQGQEFLVIILSTVRSNESASDDLLSSLGFLSNPKRFNVAVTRPKALLVIVGNPHVLIQDPCFRSLLEYSFINGAYLGCDPPPCLIETPVAKEASSL